MLYLFDENQKEYTNIAGKQIISKFHEEKVPKSSYKELRSRKYDKGGKSSSLLQAQPAPGKCLQLTFWNSHHLFPSQDDITQIWETFASANQKHFPDLNMICHLFGIPCSFLRSHFAGKPKVALQNVSCFPRLLFFVTVLILIRKQTFMRFCVHVKR